MVGAGESSEFRDIKKSLYVASSGGARQAQCRRRCSTKPSSSGMMLPNRANSVGELAAGGSTASITPAVRHGSDFTTSPRASITALIPVGVERMTGMPSSAARSRAWARCCGGPQRPNQASFDGLKMKSGRLRSVDDMAREDDFVAKLEPDLAPLPARSMVRGPGPAVKSTSPGRQPRQADRRQQRPHRQIFAVRDEVRLVVTADLAAAGRQDEDAVGCAVDDAARPSRTDRDAAGQQILARAEQRGGAGALEAARRPVLVGARILERIGDRRFRPQQQARRRRPGSADSSASRRAAFSSKPGRHLSCWPMLGWTMRICLTVSGSAGTGEEGGAKEQR